MLLLIVPGITASNVVAISEAIVCMSQEIISSTLLQAINGIVGSIDV